MKLILFFSFFFILINCSKPKTVLICGDHVCVNKAEAEQYFENNLTLEVKIINKKIKKELDLVELNLNEDSKGNKKISIESKNKTKENLKVLTNDEIIQIKRNIKNKKKSKKIVRINEENEQIFDKNLKSKRSVNKIRKQVVDVCTILKKCSIDEISKYLLEQGKKKDFPDITERQ